MQRIGMFGIGVVVAVVYWPAEAFVHAFLFSEGSFFTNLLTPDANELWMRLVISALFIGFGWYAERGMRRQAQLRERLGKKRQRLQEVIDRCYDAYISMDTNGVVTEWNRSAETMFGWPRQQILGKTLETIIPVSMREAHRKGMRQYLERNVGSWLYKPVRTQALHRDGSEFPIEMVVTPLNIDGKLEFFAFARVCPKE